MAKEKINNHASYEEYLNDLFVVAESTHRAPTKSINEILLEKAMSYGCADDEAKESLMRILKVRSGVGVFLKTVFMAYYKPP